MIMFLALTFVITFVATIVNADGQTAELLDQTGISVCGINSLPEDFELIWNLEFEGYKSQGVHGMSSSKICGVIYNKLDVNAT